MTHNPFPHLMLFSVYQIELAGLYIVNISLSVILKLLSNEGLGPEESQVLTHAFFEARPGQNLYRKPCT